MQSRDHLTVVLLKRLFEDFTGDPVVKTLSSNTRGVDLIFGGGTKVPHFLLKYGDCGRSLNKGEYFILFQNCDFIPHL